MRLAAGVTVLFWGVMLWGSLSVAVAHPLAEYRGPMRLGKSQVYVQSLRIASPQPSKGAGAANSRAKSQDVPQSSRASASAAERRDDPPSPPVRRGSGHMSPEDRRLLRQHIEDAVREIYSH